MTVSADLIEVGTNSAGARSVKPHNAPVQSYPPEDRDWHLEMASITSIQGQAGGL